MRHEVVKIFDFWIIHKFKNESIRNYLIDHERKNICIDALCAEIMKCEKLIFFNTDKYKTVIEATARMFCDVALKWAYDHNLSQAEKARLQQKEDIYKLASEAMTELEEEVTTTKLVSRPGEVAR